MTLKPNTIITLENQEKYVLLNETEYETKHYFLAMQVSNTKEVIPSNVAIFEMISDGITTYVEKVNDTMLIASITEKLKAQI